jgi:hypothetical protein
MQDSAPPSTPPRLAPTAPSTQRGGGTAGSGGMDLGRAAGGWGISPVAGMRIASPGRGVRVVQRGNPGHEAYPGQRVHMGAAVHEGAGVRTKVATYRSKPAGDSADSLHIVERRGGGYHVMEPSLGREAPGGVRAASPAQSVASSLEPFGRGSAVTTSGVPVGRGTTHQDPGSTSPRAKGLTAHAHANFLHSRLDSIGAETAPDNAPQQVTQTREGSGVRTHILRPHQPKLDAAFQTYRAQVGYVNHTHAGASELPYRTRVGGGWALDTRAGTYRAPQQLAMDVDDHRGGQLENWRTRWGRWLPRAPLPGYCTVGIGDDWQKLCCRPPLLLAHGLIELVTATLVLIDWGSHACSFGSQHSDLMWAALSCVATVVAVVIAVSQACAVRQDVAAHSHDDRIHRCDPTPWIYFAACLGGATAVLVDQMDSSAPPHRVSTLTPVTAHEMHTEFTGDTADPGRNATHTHFLEYDYPACVQKQLTQWAIMLCLAMRTVGILMTLASTCWRVGERPARLYSFWGWWAHPQQQQQLPQRDGETEEGLHGCYAEKAADAAEGEREGGTSAEDIERAQLVMAAHV